jgi:hypothetical protein
MVRIVPKLQRLLARRRLRRELGSLEAQRATAAEHVAAVVRWISEQTWAER